MLLADAPTLTPSPFTQATDLVRKFQPGGTQHAAPRCSQCAINPICNPGELNAEELAQVDSLVQEVRTVQRGAKDANR
jgi:CRP/FNR family transcriptional regulator